MNDSNPTALIITLSIIGGLFLAVMAWVFISAWIDARWWKRESAEAKERMNAELAAMLEEYERDTNPDKHPPLDKLIDVMER